MSVPVAATVGSFKATGKEHGFANSLLYATNFNAVTLASLDTLNPTYFGVYAEYAAAQWC